MSFRGASLNLRLSKLSKGIAVSASLQSVTRDNSEAMTTHFSRGLSRSVSNGSPLLLTDAGIWRPLGLAEPQL
jgi:hypothetical protein